ncbi:quinon protein alcohol dehydrogenase-like superfamily [Baffinella frigidus]|nr:quinon protein alcohol dehydrogenase-like superfamily [Cryptophyta sp. CCMP2293]
MSNIDINGQSTQQQYSNNNNNNNANNANANNANANNANANNANANNNNANNNNANNNNNGSTNPNNNSNSTNSNNNSNSNNGDKSILQQVATQERRIAELNKSLADRNQTLAKFQTEKKSEMEALMSAKKEEDYQALKTQYEELNQQKDGGVSGTMEARNMEGFHEQWTVQAHELQKKPEKDPIFTAFTVNLEGSLVITVGGGGCMDTNWKKWNTATGNLLMTGPRHDRTDGCDCSDQTDTSLWPKVAHVVSVTAVVFSPKENCFATGDRFGAVITWNTTTGRPMLRMRNANSNGWVDALSYSSNGKKLASGSTQSVCLWDAETGVFLRVFRMNPNTLLTSLHFSVPPIDPDHLVIHHGSSYETWIAETAVLVRTQHAYRFVVLSPDGRTMATTDRLARQPPTLDENTQLVRLIDTDTGQDRTQLRLEGPGRRFGKVAFSPDSKRVAALVSQDASEHSCRVYDSSTGAELHKIILTGRMDEFTMTWSHNIVWETQRNTAFAMGYHERLGVNSWIIKLDPGVIRMILDQ